MPGILDLIKRQIETGGITGLPTGGMRPIPFNSDPQAMPSFDSVPAVSPFLPGDQGQSPVIGAPTPAGDPYGIDALETEQAGLIGKAYGGKAPQARSPINHTQAAIALGVSGTLRLAGVSDKDVGSGLQGFIEGTKTKAQMDHENRLAEDARQRQAALAQSGVVGQKIAYARRSKEQADNDARDAKNQKINDLRDQAGRILTNYRTYSSANLPAMIEQANKMLVEAGLPGMVWTQDQIDKAVDEVKAEETRKSNEKSWPKDWDTLTKQLALIDSNIGSANVAGAKAAAATVQLIVDKYPDIFAKPENMAAMNEIRAALGKVEALTKKEELDITKKEDIEATRQARINRIKSQTGVDEARANKLDTETSFLDDKIAQGWERLRVSWFTAQSADAKRKADIQNAQRDDVRTTAQAALKDLQTKRKDLQKRRGEQGADVVEIDRQITEIGTQGKQVIDAAKEMGVDLLRSFDKPATLKGDYRQLESFAKQHGFTVTDGMATSGHNEGSPHYKGLAVDVRTRDKSDAEIQAFMKAARDAGIRVVDERTRPKGQKVWTGPHLHLEIAPGSGNAKPKAQAGTYDTKSTKDQLADAKKRGENTQPVRRQSGRWGAAKTDAGKKLSNMFGK